MIVPNEKFRANPNRAIYVSGRINREMVQTLTPAIMSLQHASRAPITVYIDSPGGDVISMNTLWRLLNASNQDHDPACDIITVVTSKAASAAADLLSRGDYAIAYPNATVFYHGARTLTDSESSFILTVQSSSLLALTLRATNEVFAADLAKKVENRLMLKFVIARAEFDAVRSRERSPKMTDAECFLSLMSDGLSDKAKIFLNVVKARQSKYDTLVGKAKRRMRRKSTVAKMEARRIKDIVDFEMESNKADKSWTFHDLGLLQLNDDFFLLSEHEQGLQRDRIERFCSIYGNLTLDEADKAEIDRAPEEEKKDKLIQKVRPRLEPLSTFFVALCHALQEGENEFTATDAFWLGLIDEVIGKKDLPSLRTFMEYKVDPPQPQQPRIAEGG